MHTILIRTLHAQVGQLISLNRTVADALILIEKYPCLAYSAMRFIRTDIAIGWTGHTGFGLSGGRVV